MKENEPIMIPYGVVIGRLQPVHLGHLYMIEQALAQCEQVLILVGSAYRAPTVKNPFSFEQRCQLIRDNLAALQDDYLARVHFMPIEDVMYDENLWNQSVRAAVHQYAQAPLDVALVAHDKDASTYYLASFPEWRFLSLPHFRQISATPLRQAWLAGYLWDNAQLCDQLPTVTQNFLRDYEQQADYRRLQREHQCITQYQAEWSGTPYPVIFSTTDAVVICQQHILLVRRKYPPGQNLLALPGGFLEANEWVYQGLVRELREETAIEVADKKLQSALQTLRVFDHHDRSQIGRVITHAGLFLLAENNLPMVNAADDALEAFWFPLTRQTELRTQMHDDHYYIVQQLLSDNIISGQA